MKLIDEISRMGIVPVIAIEKVENAEPLAKALCGGGLPCAEITFRTDAAEESIRIMALKYPDMLIGAGTVLTPEQADRAISAGAKFIVSPGLNPKVVKHCIEKGYTILPGCANPSDVETAIELGLETVKFFPAEQAGGLNMIKAMSAPYGKIKFMPTGGISPDNLISYLNFSKIVACGGSWMCPSNLINNKEFDKIEELTRTAIRTMLGFELAHIGINAKDESEADSTADFFDKTFGFTKKIGNSSIFAGTGFEVMKFPYLGANGHIAVKTNYIERAVYHLEKQGVSFNMDTAKYDKSNKLMAVYFTDEVNGFAVHLVQKS